MSYATFTHKIILEALSHKFNILQKLKLKRDLGLNSGKGIQRSEAQCVLWLLSTWMKSSFRRKWPWLLQDWRGQRLERKTVFYKIFLHLMPLTRKKRLLDVTKIVINGFIVNITERTQLSLIFIKNRRWLVPKILWRNVCNSIKRYISWL